MQKKKKKKWRKKTKVGWNEHVQFKKKNVNTKKVFKITFKIYSNNFY